MPSNALYENFVREGYNPNGRGNNYVKYDDDGKVVEGKKGKGKGDKKDKKMSREERKAKKMDEVRRSEERRTGGAQRRSYTA